MYKRCAGLFAAFLLTACTSFSGSGDDRERTALLKSVPSDAVAVVCDRQLSGIVPLLDRKDPILKLHLEEFPSRQAVLSFGFTGEKSTLLSLPIDTSWVSRSLIARADSIGLVSRQVKLDGFDILTLSGSGTMISESQHHIRSGTSIFNAPFFNTAYSQTGVSDRVAFIRNQAIPRLCPKDFLSQLMPRRQLVEFFRAAACWTTIENSTSVKTFQNAEPVFYGHLCQSFPAGELRIREILPENATFALSQSAGSEKWRDMRRKYLDAQAVLDRYDKALAEYGRERNPEKWEKANHILEAAVVLAPAGKVLALRSDAWTDKACDLFDPGFAGLLYGKAYALQDAPVVAICGQWLLAGTEDAVSAIEAEMEKNNTDRLKSCRFYIQTPDFVFFDDDGNWSLQSVNNQE